MADDLAIGRALIIPQSVLNNLNKVDAKINQIASDSEKMATHFTSAMTRMDNSTNGLVQKLQSINTLVQNIGGLNANGLVGISNSMSRTSTEAEKLANSVSKAASAMNKMNSRSSDDASRKAYIEKYKMYERMFDQIERNEKRAIQAAEREAKAVQAAEERKLKALRKAYDEQARIYRQQNIKQNTTVSGSLSFAESANTIARRTTAIQYLTEARRKLSTTDADYSNKLRQLNEAIARMNRLNNEAIRGSNSLRESHSKLMNTSDQLMRKLALIFSVSQIQSYVMNLAKVRGEFELQNTALASILQNKDQADKLFGQITELAVKSPFTLKELVTYTKSLSAYQVEYEKLYDTTKMLADVSAGLGVDMQRLILAFGQVKAANFLRGTETRQFTEAGINLLGELSKYYTELEGRIVSVGEVQDRQFKRMISFQDVEEVFKRLTSSGGMFYNMQEKQAETLLGMMSNLQDSIDIMLNSIGKANDGVLKGVVSSIKFLVDNWQIFANLIQTSSIAFVIYATKTYLAARANGAFAASTIDATVKQKGLVAALAKTKIAMGKFKSFVVSNPFLLLASGIIFASMELYDHYKKVMQNKEAYDILTNTLSKTKRDVDDLVGKISENNSKISSLNNIINSTSAGTEDYSKAQDDLNKAQNEQKLLLNELQAKYPDIYNGIVRQKDGTIELADAQRKYNEELEKTSVLNVLMSQGESFFNEGIIKDFQDLADAQGEYSKQTQNLEASYNAVVSLIEILAKTNNEFYNDSYEGAKKIIESNDSLYDKMFKLRTLIRNTSASGYDMSKLSDIFSNAIPSYSKAWTKYLNTTYEANKEVENLIKNLLTVANVTSKTEFKGLDEASKKAAMSYAETFIKSIPNIKNKFIQEFVNERFEAELGVTFNFKEYTEKQLGYLEKSIKEYTSKNELTLLPAFKEDRGANAYFEELRDRYKTIEEDVEKLSLATEQLNEGTSNKQKIKDLENEKKQVRQLLEAYGEFEKTNKEKKGESAELKRLKEQIALIKKAGEEYKKLRKYRSEEDSNAAIRKSFGDAFSNLSLSMDMTFDTSGIIEGIKSLTNKAGEDGNKAIKEALAPLESEREINLSVKGLDDIQKKVDNIFTNYEFTLEMKTAGVDPDAFRNILKDVGASDEDIAVMGFDIKDFEDLQYKIREVISQLQKQGGTESLKLAQKYQEQLTALEVKEAKKRFSELSSLREKYQSNDDKISKLTNEMIDWQQELDFIRSLADETKKEQEELLELKIKNAEDTIRQLESEALQLTSFWQRLFGDLNDISVRSLLELSRITNEILANRQEIKGDSGETKGYTSSYTDANGMSKQVTLTKQQYQQLLKQNNQVADEIQKKNPFLALWEAIKKGKNAGESQLDYYIRLDSILNGVTDAAFGAAQNLADIFNADDDAKEMISNIQGIAEGAVSLGTGIARMASGDIIGGSMAAISGIASIITSINKIHDAKREKEIQRQIDLVDNLEKKYEDLKDAIDAAYSFDTLTASTKQMNKNLEAQNKALEAMIAAEEDKKKTDKDRIQEWYDQIEANNKQMQENNKELVESLGGLGTDANVQSAAEEFAQAWLDSFLEIGDGMEGLKEQMQDLMNQAIQKQLLTRLSEQYITPILNEFDKMFSEYGAGGQAMTAQELAAWQKLYETKSEQFNAAAEAYINALKQAGVDIGGTTTDEEMSGLSRSISGITEDTADALASITESIRFFVSDSNMQLRNIYNWLINPPVESPLYIEIREQTNQLRMIYNMFNSIIKSVPNGGKAMQIKMM